MIHSCKRVWDEVIVVQEYSGLPRGTLSQKLQDKRKQTKTLVSSIHVCQHCNFNSITSICIVSPSRFWCISTFQILAHIFSYNNIIAPNLKVFLPYPSLKFLDYITYILISTIVIVCLVNIEKYKPRSVTVIITFLGIPAVKDLGCELVHPKTAHHKFTPVLNSKGQQSLYGLVWFVCLLACLFLEKSGSVDTTSQRLLGFKLTMVSFIYLNTSLSCLLNQCGRWVSSASSNGPLQLYGITY